MFFAIRPLRQSVLLVPNDCRVTQGSEAMVICLTSLV